MTDYVPPSGILPDNLPLLLLFTEYFGFLIEGLRIPADADHYEDLYEFALAARGIGDAQVSMIDMWDLDARVTLVAESGRYRSLAMIHPV